MKMKFEFKQLENFADTLVNESRDQELRVLIEKLVKSFLENAKTFTPVVTGTMRSHWDIDNANFEVRKLARGGYSVTIYNKAKNKYGYAYARDVDQGHKSYNQYGGPYVVKNSKYGLNGGDVIGRFIVEDAINKTQYDIRKEVASQLQKWLDRCVINAK